MTISTLDDAVTEVRRRAMSGLQQEQDTLGGNIVAGATSFTLSTGQTLGSISAGTVVEIDYEQFWVSSTTAPNTVNVIPGYNGSTEANHSSGAYVRVNPRFTAVDIISAINEDLDDLSSSTNGLFQPAEVTVSYNPVFDGYDLTDVNTSVAVVPNNFIDLLEVRIHDYGPAQRWPRIPLSRLEIQRQADTSVFPSGIAIVFKEKQAYPGRPVRIQYKAPYTHLVNANDTFVNTAGMHSQAVDIPTLGAAYRLMAFREFKRSFSEAQPEPRRAQEVPVGASLTAVKLVAQQRTDRIAAERQRLENWYPVRYS